MAISSFGNMESQWDQIVQKYNNNKDLDSTNVIEGASYPENWCLWLLLRGYTETYIYHQQHPYERSLDLASTILGCEIDEDTIYKSAIAIKTVVLGLPMSHDGSLAFTMLSNNIWVRQLLSFSNVVGKYIRKRKDDTFSMTMLGRTHGLPTHKAEMTHQADIATFLEGVQLLTKMPKAYRDMIHTPE